MNSENMSIFVFLGVFWVILFTYCQALDPIIAEFCNENVTPHYLRNLDLALEPSNPVIISKGGKIKIHLGFDILRKYPPEGFSNVTVELELVHIRNELPNIEIPCIKLTINGSDYNVGSCKYDAAMILDMTEKLIGKECIKRFPGNGCHLPFIPGHYMHPYLSNVEFNPLTIPEDLSDDVVNLLKRFSGKNRVTIHIFDDHGKEICWSWTLNVLFQD